MEKISSKGIRWDFYAVAAIASVSLLHLIRWSSFPQFMDIYYHILTAWGFNQAGGYTSWDFWQYAPVGRIHIYPPLFHIGLAALLKLSINPVLIAKLCESLIPILFLFSCWSFIRRNFNARLAFFVVAIVCSSYTFFNHLANHLPAALAMIFCLIGYGQLLKGQYVRAALLFTACFYTHIGVSWWCGISLLFFGLLNNSLRRRSLSVLLWTVLLSLPVIAIQIKGVRSISSVGLSLNEITLSQVKIIEYILAFAGILVSIKAKDQKYRFFVSLFLASLIFLSYPYRFFSAEGYLAVIFLAAVCLEHFYIQIVAKDMPAKIIFAAATLAILTFSPRVFLINQPRADKRAVIMDPADSVFLGLLSPGSGIKSSMWHEDAYVWAARIVGKHSAVDEAMFSTINVSGVGIASIAGRPTANGLFKEINVANTFDPVSNSRIIVAARDESPAFINALMHNYRLTRIGENKLFVIYKNEDCATKVKAAKARLPFWLVAIAIAAAAVVYWKPSRLEKLLNAYDRHP